MKSTLLIFFVSILIWSCQSQNKKQQLIYLGNISGNANQGIQAAYFNPETGEISNPVSVAEIAQPNFLSIDIQDNIIYCVGKDNSNNESVVGAFKINGDTTKFTKLSFAPVMGNGPCFIEYNKQSNKIITANYGSGNVCMYNSNKGSLSFLNSYQHTGAGPDKSRQEKPHAHSIRFSPDNEYLYAADLGADKIMIYEGNTNTFNPVDSIICTPGAGPRHIDFSPDGKTMAVVNELSSTLSIYNKQGSLYTQHVQTLNMLPDTFKSFSKAADVHFTPDGKFIYASNRGFNSLAIYKVVEDKIEFIGWETEGINWPRNFAIDPSGNYILIANQKGNNITVYQRNIQTGLLTKLNHEISIESPVCIRFFNK